jgi:ribosome maturation factor RimP
MDGTEEVRKLLEKPLSDKGYEIYSIRLARGKEGLTLEIVVDRPDPISMDDILGVSELINPLLDEADPIKEPYTLDVSSLGAEKPIRLDRLKDYVGRYVSVHLSRAMKGSNSFEGTLKSADGDVITIIIRDKSREKEVNIPRDSIDKARLAIRF